jgi:pimeloyl-ACP methyl ester carboxylesterase
MSAPRTVVQLPVVAAGDPAGMPVVLLHGLSDSWRSFETVLSHLHVVRAMAMTLRGHGDAPKPDGGYDAGTLADDVVAVLDDAGVQRAVVVGHSMGTIIGTRLAIDHPERVAGLVLAGGRATFDGPDMREFFGFLDGIEDPVDPGFLREFQESTVERPVPAGVIDSAVAESCKVPARVWRALAAGTLRADHTADLGLVEAPTLLCAGGTDPYVSLEDQRVLLHGIPDARLWTIPGAGHAMHWEDPAGFARGLLAFIGERVVV